MKKPVKALLIGIGLIAAAAIVLAIGALRYGGAFGTIEPAFAGSCAAVALGGSSEDIQIDRERGIAYLSYLDRASLIRGEALNGTVMLLDLNLANPTPRAAMAHDPDPRSPTPAAGEKDPRLTQVYLGSGEEISAGTVAAAWHDEFLIGALFDKKVLICKPNP